MGSVLGGRVGCGGTEGAAWHRDGGTEAERGTCCRMARRGRARRAGERSAEGDAQPRGLERARVTRGVVARRMGDVQQGDTQQGSAAGAGAAAGRLWQTVLFAAPEMLAAGGSQQCAPRRTALLSLLSSLGRRRPPSARTLCAPHHHAADGQRQLPVQPQLQGNPRGVRESGMGGLRDPSGSQGWL